MGIKFDELRKRLESIEAGVASPALPTLPASQAIRDASGGAQVQLCGLDRNRVEKPLPVVIAVGGNYTQAKTVVPRDLTPPHGVLDDLAACRKNLSTALQVYNTHKHLWWENSAASHSVLSPPKEFHLVMTNFCLWITKNSWQNTGAATRTALLECNPLFNNKSTLPGDWAHLIALRDALAGIDVLWVGHGIHCEVFALFRQFMREVPGQRWLLLPNLAYHYNYADWHFLKGNDL